MAISPALVARYTSETDQDWWEGLILSHSLVRGDNYYLCDQPTAQYGIVDGISRRFLPVPFRLVAPQRDAEGLQDLRLAICAVGGEIITVLRAAAADPTERIRCRWGVWMGTSLYDGTPTRTPLIDPLPELSLTAVQVTDDLITASATSVDILRRPFPSVLTRLDLYPGLDRR